MEGSMPGGGEWKKGGVNHPVRRMELSHGAWKEQITMKDDSNRFDGTGTLEILLTASQRALILDRASPDPAAAKVLRGVAGTGTRVAVKLLDEDWEAIAGDLSVVANHTKDRSLQSKLDALIETIEDALLFDEEEDEDDE